MYIKLIAVRELYQIILDPKEECLLKLALLNKPNFGKNGEKGKSFVYDLMLLLDCNFGECWKHGYGVDRDELELLRFILVYQNNLDLYRSMIEELDAILSSPEYLEFVKQEEAYQQLVDDSMKN